MTLIVQWMQAQTRGQDFVDLIAVQNVIITAAQPVHGDELATPDQALGQCPRNSGELIGRKVISDLAENDQIEWRGRHEGPQIGADDFHMRLTCTADPRLSNGTGREISSDHAGRDGCQLTGQNADGATRFKDGRV